MFVKITSIVALAGIASAQSVGLLSPIALSYVPEACRNQCSGLVNNVMSCIGNIDQTYMVSVNPSNISSFQISGDFNALAQCACNNEAIGASAECLQCASAQLHLDPALTMQDMAAVCQNPLDAGKAIFERYHKRLLGGGSGGSETTSSAGPEETSTAEEDTSTSEEETSTTSAEEETSTSAEEPIPTPTKKPCACKHKTRTMRR